MTGKRQPPTPTNVFPGAIPVISPWLSMVAIVGSSELYVTRLECSQIELGPEANFPITPTAVAARPDRYVLGSRTPRDRVRGGLDYDLDCSGSNLLTGPTMPIA